MQERKTEGECPQAERASEAEKERQKKSGIRKKCNERYLKEKVFNK